jgi:hypothetical protein
MPTTSSTNPLASRCLTQSWHMLAIAWLIGTNTPGIATTPLANRSPHSTLHISDAKSKPNLQKLCAELQSTSVDRRVSALRQLATMGPAAAKATADIIEVLTDNRSFGAGAGNGSSSAFVHRISPEVTAAAIDALTAIGPGAESASPYLVNILSDRNELYRRSQVLNALAVIGADNSAAKIVMRIVGEEGKSTSTHTQAIVLLGKLNPPAVEALDLLKQIAEDQSDQSGRKAALQAISSIERITLSSEMKKPTPENAQENKISAELASNDKKQQLDAMDLIGELDGGGAMFVPRLMLLLRDGDNDINSGVLDALANIGPPASAAAPALVAQLMAERDSGRRGEICRTITQIDPVGKLSIPLIRPALDDPFKARTAIELLDRLGTNQTAEIAAASRKRWCIK